MKWIVLLIVNVLIWIAIWYFMPNKPNNNKILEEKYKEITKEKVTNETKNEAINWVIDNQSK